MGKRIIVFYDVLLYAIICGPMIVATIMLLLVLISNGTSEWIYKNWYLVLFFAITFMVPVSGTLMLRYCTFNKNSTHFHYFPFTNSWKKAVNNIDIKWNQDVLICQIRDVEIVKLTLEEKQTKVYYKHWFNKYLKINLISGKSKYVYIGNYTNY